VGLQRFEPWVQPATQTPSSHSGVGGEQAARSFQPPELLHCCGWLSLQRLSSGTQVTQKPSRQAMSQTPMSTNSPPVQGLLGGSLAAPRVLDAAAHRVGLRLGRNLRRQVAPAVPGAHEPGGQLPVRSRSEDHRGVVHVRVEAPRQHAKERKDA
jgi:hypothetical protein